MTPFELCPICLGTKSYWDGVVFTECTKCNNVDLESDFIIDLEDESEEDISEYEGIIRPRIYQ